jgi:uncharacterized protein YebE (UPF0316 family)
VSLFGWLPHTAVPMLPLLIFVAELTVVTLCTIRIIFVARGKKFLAPLLGFFEITIWLFAIGQVMRNINDLSCFAAFAGGFTVGNFLGVFIEQKLAIGNLVVRIITSKDVQPLVQSLASAGYGVTRVAGQGATGPVQIILTVIQRRVLREVIALIKNFDEKAFYSIDDLQAASQGVFPAARKPVLGWLRSWREALPPSTAGTKWYDLSMLPPGR